MKCTHLLALTYLLVACVTVAGQSSEANKTAPAKNVAANSKPTGDPEAERLLRERRTQAQSLLISLAIDAGSFKDQRLRARTQARIADVLWEAETDRARNLFRKAWDAAEIADAESQLKLQEEIREQRAKSGGGGYGVTSPPDLRKEVLRLAVKHDTALAEEFLAKLLEKNKEGGAKENPRNPRDKDPAATQRLEVAKELLSSDKERAVEFGRPLLNTISQQSIEFLSTLREKNAAQADELYASLLNLAAADPQSDLNTVAMLSSYIFSPHAYVYIFGAGELARSRGLERKAPSDVSPALRLAFFQVASRVLMRPIQPGQDFSVYQTYRAISNYLPLFEQFATPELTAGLRAQQEAVTAMVPENQRLTQDETTREDTSPQQRIQNMEQSTLDRIDRARTSGERDQLFMQLAISRSGSGDPKAREYADKIEDSELRQSVRAYIDASLAWSAIEKKDAERALEIVRTGELTRLLKVWTMTSAARLLMTPKSGKPDRERALQILDDALAEARRMDGPDPDRPRAFVAVTNAMLMISPPRGWDSMNDAVKAANSAPDFSGEDGEVSFRIITKGSRAIHQHQTSDFNLVGVFQKLANADFDRAVELARVFEREAPRANAVMAIALTVVNEKKK